MWQYGGIENCFQWMMIHLTGNPFNLRLDIITHIQLRHFLMLPIRQCHSRRLPPSLPGILLQCFTCTGPYMLSKCHTQHKCSFRIRRSRHCTKHTTISVDMVVVHTRYSFMPEFTSLADAHSSCDAHLMEAVCCAWRLYLPASPTSAIWIALYPAHSSSKQVPLCHATLCTSASRAITRSLQAEVTLLSSGRVIYLR